MSVVYCTRNILLPISDANNDLVIPSKGSMSDLRGDNPENGKEKEESKERNMTNETLEGTSTTDENILEIPSVVCDELTIEGMIISCQFSYNGEQLSFNTDVGLFL